MSIGLLMDLDPRFMWNLWRMTASQMGGVTPFKSPLPHPFAEHAQQALVDPVVQTNRDYYVHSAGDVQAVAGVATSAYQTAVMVIAGFMDMVGATLNEDPRKVARGIFADTLNMVFSLESRVAKMTIEGVPGESVFDQTVAVANLMTEVVMVGEGLKGVSRGVAGVGPRLASVVESLSKTVDRLTPTPAAALVDGGLMMAAEDNHSIAPAASNQSLMPGGSVIEAELDEAATKRKEALDEALQIPAPGFRANALTGTLDMLARNGEWDDFVYAAGHAFDAAAEVGDKKAALPLRQELSFEIARLMPDDVKIMPNAKVRGQLAAIIERELPEAGRNAQFSRALQAVQDKLVGWERVARERTPDTPLPATLRVIQQVGNISWYKKIPGAAWVASLFAVFFKSPADVPATASVIGDFSAIGPCPDGFAYIPAGSFAMGSEAEQADEQPLHKVELDAFCMARTATTNKAYWDVTGKSPSPTKFDSPQQPVVNVNWQEAHDYCQATGGALPTEAQWEKAAKGPEGYPYGTHSGKLNKKEANYASSATVAVGSYLPNGYGLYDMTGNVWEWSQDWYLKEAYASHSSQNPTGPTNGQYKVLRGGSWVNLTDFLRAADRYYYFPDVRNSVVGFRCVVAPQDSK